MPVLDSNALIDNRVQAIIKAHDRASVLRAELDLSGGIDSAVMAGLLVLALGPENVTLAHTRMSTAGTQTKRARNLATAIGCRLADGAFSGAFNVIMEELLASLRAAGYDRDAIDARVAKDPTIMGSIRSTLRAPLGRAYNRLTGGGIRHGTGNECEDRFLRFYQKGGDGEVDSNPLAMLSKTEVYQLAFALGQTIPNSAAAFREIIEATPSPDLWGTGDGHSDEAELLTWTGAPFTYGRIDSLTGEIVSYGTIERVARFLDVEVDSNMGVGTVEDILFSHNDMNSDVPMKLAEWALNTQLFDGFEQGDIATLLAAARKTERITRHKMNPNCPSYGTREALVAAGILTNDLTVGRVAVFEHREA